MKVLKGLEAVADTLFLDLSADIDQIRQLWFSICSDPLFPAKVAQATTNKTIPTWRDSLGGVYPISCISGPYHVLGVDGSQIYPDRHQGSLCFLINVGIIQLHYGCCVPAVVCSNEPFVYSGTENPEQGTSVDMVNCRRQELEFKFGLECSSAIKSANSQVPYLFLFDGSLIFWHLDSKQVSLWEYFLPTYIAYLNQFYQNDILMAGYISLPRSRELVNLLHLAATDFDDTKESSLPLERMVDVGIASFFLNPSERSIVFKNNSHISQYYPEHVAPHFFYMHVGSEIVRIEVPGWIAQDAQKIETIASIILDHTQKGHGYPVCLAEAHEQAVVKGADRDFFYHLVQKLSFERRRYVKISPKSLKKRHSAI